MALLDDIGKKISQTTQSAVKGTKEFAGSAVKGTKDFAESSKLNSQIAEENKTISNLYAQIGMKYYETHKTSAEGEFAAMCKAITESTARIEAYKEEIHKIKGLKTCPNCGADVPMAVMFCARCGGDTRTDDEKAAAMSAPQPSPNFAPNPPPPPMQGMQVPAQGIMCPNCGKTNNGDAVFCTGCGFDVRVSPPFQQAAPQTAPQGVICPNCGKSLADGAAFCTGCGSKV